MLCCESFHIPDLDIGLQRTNSEFLFIKNHYMSFKLLVIASMYYQFLIECRNYEAGVLFAIQNSLL